MFDRTVCVSIFCGTDDVQSGIVCGTVTRVNSAYMFYTGYEALGIYVLFIDLPQIRVCTVKKYLYILNKLIQASVVRCGVVCRQLTVKCYQCHSVIQYAKVDNVINVIRLYSTLKRIMLSMSFGYTVR